VFFQWKFNKPGLSDVLQIKQYYFTSSVALSSANKTMHYYRPKRIFYIELESTQNKQR
jgi:hypothetical protein